MRTKTELAFWQQISDSIEPPPWHSRFEKMVRFIRPNDRVLDFGCGNQYLRTLLHPSNEYQPIDCVGDSGRGVFICDYNQKFEVPKFKPTVLFFGGFFEYIYDVENFMRQLHEAYPGVYCIFSYAWFPSENRSVSHWVNYLGNQEGVLAFFGQYIDGLRHVDDWADHSKQMICVGQLKPWRKASAVSRWLPLKTN